MQGDALALSVDALALSADALALSVDALPLVTTEFVLLEVADALCTPVSRIQTVAFINSRTYAKTLSNSYYFVSFASLRFVFS
ncbi:hypothetical protein [Nostoc sp. CHAB 5715]|uniref:hypothetical protein n=1 Tax=Nostoc sp. CHAB 5715 TaxID=2780400 RepID=UPI001E5EA8B5|nr:hypothetical protein [Nostoc sp. CHAB 5715]MCC5624365.1 hypothetical protein [Nostoc sp. CHAB 5715]